MKKIISLVLMVTMLFGVSAFAEEEFTLHNGTKFGMSIDEVVNLEKEAGFSTNRRESKAAEELGLAFQMEFSVSGKGKIAGYDETDIYYSFDDGKLYRMCYVFDGNCFQELENALEKKYGKTEYYSSSGMVLPEFTANVTHYPFFYTGIVSKENRKRTTRTSYEYSQRLIGLSEAEYVYIECQHYYYDFGMQLGKLVGTNQYKTYYTADRTQVTYHLLDAKTAEILLEALEQLNNDL